MAAVLGVALPGGQRANKRLFGETSSAVRDRDIAAAVETGRMGIARIAGIRETGIA